MPNFPFAKKSLGQHWLNDRSSLVAMCRKADISANDVILEIGPGIGTLTKLLVERAKEVVAVEYDEKLAAGLPKQITSKNLQVIYQDILRFDLTDLPPDYKVVANIPYYLTSNLIRVLSESTNPPVLVVLLVQKEVAERVAANPGAMSILSITAQYYWQVSLGKVVPAGLFLPPPKVDSQILVLIRRQSPLFAEINENKFFQVVKAGFSGRRKTLLNSLSGGLGQDKRKVGQMLADAGIDQSLRAQNLSLEDWHKLYVAFTGSLNKNT